MSVQRIHLHVSKESLAYGRRLARQKKTGQLHAKSGKSFSERWAGKITLHTPDKSDQRGTLLAKKNLLK